MWHRSLSDLAMDPPCRHYSHVQRIRKKWPVPFLPTNRWPVWCHHPVHEVNTTHSFIVSVDKVRLLDIVDRLSFHTPSHFMHWRGGLAVASSATVMTELSFHLHMNTVPSQQKSIVPRVLFFITLVDIKSRFCSSRPVFPHCASSFHFLGCQVGKELVGCEEVVEEEVVLCNIRILPNNFNHVIDDPRAKGLVAGCCLFAFVDLQAADSRTNRKCSRPCTRSGWAFHEWTSSHCGAQSMAPSIHQSRQIFVEHSKLGKGGVNTGANWSNLRNFVALLQVVVVRKVNVALDVAKTCAAHCLWNNWDAEVFTFRQMMVFFEKMMIAQQKKDAKEGRNIFAASRKSRKIAVTVCIQVGLLHDVIHEGRWEDFTPNVKWRLCGEVGKLFLKVSLKARIIQRDVECCTFSPPRNVLSANTLARRFRIRIHVSTFRLFSTAVVDLEFSSSLETIFFLRVIRHIHQITVGITNITITRRKNSKMSRMRLFFSSLQSLQVDNKPHWPKPGTVKGTRVTLHCVARILWTDGRPLKWWKRQTGATAPQPAVIWTPRAYLKALAFQLIYQLQVLNPYGRRSATFITPFLFVIHCKAN